MLITKVFHRLVPITAARPWSLPLKCFESHLDVSISARFSFDSRGIQIFFGILNNRLSCMRRGTLRTKRNLKRTKKSLVFPFALR